MSENKGAIQFNNYRVVNVEFKLNKEFSWGKEEVDLDIQVESNIRVSEDRREMLVGLAISIFDDIEKSKVYPFSMKVQLEGYFTMQKAENSDDIENYYANALAILYPYARSIVSNFTASANIEPLILPTVNINSLIREQRSKK